MSFIFNKMPPASVHIKFYLIALSFMLTGLVYAEQPTESPPFRAWWPIVNKELEAGTRDLSQKTVHLKRTTSVNKNMGSGWIYRSFSC